MNRVHRVLAEFRAAAARRAALEALVRLAFVGGVAAWLVSVALALVTEPAALRGVALTAIALGLFVGIATNTARALWRFRRDADAAAWLEERVPSLRSDVRASLDFDRSTPATDPIAVELRTVLKARVERAVWALRPTLAQLVPSRPVRREVIAAASTIAALVALAAIAPDGLGRGARALLLGVPATAQATAPVSTKPLVGTIDAVIHHPAYTRISPTRVSNSTGDLHTLVGSEIELRTTALRPVDSAALRVREGERETVLQLDVVDGHELSGRIQVGASSEYRFELRDGDETALDPRVRRIHAIADERPTIELLEPKGDLEVTPDAIIDLHYVARDDFGLSEIALVWHFVGDEGRPRRVGLQGRLDAPHFEEHVPFDLQPLRLQPRDEVVVFIEAADNDGVSGSKTGTSRAVTLRVGSSDDRNREVLEMKEALFEALLQQLGGLLAAEVNDFEANDGRLQLVPADVSPDGRVARVAAAAEVSGRWTSALELFEGLLVATHDDSLSIAADLDLLAGAHEHLNAAVLDERRELEKLTGRDASWLTVERFSALAAGTAEVTRTTERTVLLLEDLVATHKADAVQRAIAELSEARARLQELLQQYRDARDPALREQIEREVRRLEQRMRELLEQISAQVENLPLEHLNADAIEPHELAENVDQMRSALDRIREMLDADDIDGALSFLEELEAELEAMGRQLEPLGDSTPQTLSEFDQQMGALMDALNDVETHQGSLEAETQTLLDAMLRERAEAIEERSSAMLEQAAQAIEEALQRHTAADRDQLAEDTQRALRNSEESLETLLDHLRRGDATAAEDMASRLQSQLSDARWDLMREAAMRTRDDQAVRQANEARRANTLADDAVSDAREAMERLMQLGQPQPNAQQRTQLTELADRQRSAEQQLEALQRQVGQMGERFPMVNDQLGAPLEQVGESMQQATSELRGHRPRPALQAEQSALEGMRELRQQMQQLTQRQRQREQRGARRSANDRVEVPEDGASGREAFRREVIESMREGTLEPYEAQIRRYYERLLE